jgi:hypothetical protein
LALVNLVRIAPVYVSNTIFEIVRNRYNIIDATYEDIININKKGPQITQTKEGIHAVDELI